MTALMLLVLAAATAVGTVMFITWVHVDRLQVDNDQLRGDVADWREEAEAWRDHAQSVETQIAAAHQDELALARHHRLAARQGLRCTWGRGVTNDPRSS